MGNTSKQWPRSKICRPRELDSSILWPSKHYPVYSGISKYKHYGSRNPGLPVLFIYLPLAWSNSLWSSESIEGRAESSTPVFIAFPPGGSIWMNSHSAPKPLTFYEKPGLLSLQRLYLALTLWCTENRSWYRTRHPRLLTSHFTSRPLPARLISTCW